MRMHSNQSPWWRLVTWIQICASLNYRKAKKAEPCSRLIPGKLAANLELSNVLKKHWPTFISSWQVLGNTLIQPGIGSCWFLVQNTVEWWKTYSNHFLHFAGTLDKNICHKHKYIDHFNNFKTRQEL